MPKRRVSAVKWTIKRRGPGWIAIVFVGEAPLTVSRPLSKPEARAIARQRAAEIRM